MNDKAVVGVHWSFWAISAVTLIYNVAGVMNFFMQMNAEMLASFPESHRAIIEGRPVWATGGFAIAVFGGALGCLLLLLRKPAAFYVFIASLLGAVVTMFPILCMAGSDFGPAEFVIGNLVQFVVTAFLIWYSKWVESKGWIS